MQTAEHESHHCSPQQQLPQPKLKPSAFRLLLAIAGAAESDLEHPVSTASLCARGLNVGQVLRRLRATYCRHIGVQFMHIDDPEARRWLQERMESTENRMRLTLEDQTKLLAKLTDADTDFSNALARTDEVTRPGRDPRELPVTSRNFH